MCAARARDIYEKQAKERQKVRKGDQPGATPENLPELKPTDARDAAGKAFGVSGQPIEDRPQITEIARPLFLRRGC